MADDIGLGDINEPCNKSQKLFIKKFTIEEEIGAELLIQNLLGNKDNIIARHEDREAFVTSKDWVDYNHAIPSQFKFYFPTDNAKCYEGINTKMVNLDDDSIMFNIQNKNKRGLADDFAYDVFFYLHDSLDFGITEFFSCDGENHGWESDNGDTVIDVVHKLLRFGFQYNKEAECLFKQEITSFLEQHELDENIGKISKNSSNNKI